MAALSRFIAKLGEKALPFYNLMKKTEKFEWTSKAQAAFDISGASHPDSEGADASIHSSHHTGGKYSDEVGPRQCPRLRA